MDMRISENEQQQRRDNIINAAFYLFCARGIEKVTFAEVARRAGVGAATIYRYFPNKPALVLSTMRVLWEKITMEIDGEILYTDAYNALSGLEQLGVQMDSLAQLYINHADYIQFSYEAKIYLVRNKIKITPHLFDQLMDGIRVPCMQAIEKGQADGSIPTEEKSENLFYALWGAIRGYIVKIVLYDALCEEESPWGKRYIVLKRGLLCALQNGWSQNEGNQSQISS